jgi:hypothetical protein
MPSNTSKTEAVRKNKRRAHKANRKADQKRIDKNNKILSKR